MVRALVEPLIFQPHREPSTLKRVAEIPEILLGSQWDHLTPEQLLGIQRSWTEALVSRFRDAELAALYSMSEVEDLQLAEEGLDEYGRLLDQAERE
jgi:hypothetical protein